MGGEGYDGSHWHFKYKHYWAHVATVRLNGESETRELIGSFVARFYQFCNQSQATIFTRFVSELVRANS
jgi:hypothetical protein